MSTPRDSDIARSTDAAPEQAAAHATAFETDAPLYTQFPVTLANGRAIPGVQVVCSKCDERLTGDRLRGRVIQSLAHVVTVSANGYCVCCHRLTHVDFRFRATPQATIVEWLANNGRWQAREMPQPTGLARVVSWLRGWSRLIR